MGPRNRERRRRKKKRKLREQHGNPWDWMNRGGLVRYDRADVARVVQFQEFMRGPQAAFSEKVGARAVMLVFAGYGYLGGLGVRGPRPLHRLPSPRYVPCSVQVAHVEGEE